MTATSSLHQMEAEDFAVAGLHFKSGAVGSLFASTASYPHGTETITLHCELGSLLLSSEELVVSWRDGRREHYPAHSGAAQQQRCATPKHLWHQAVIEDFIDALQEDREPIVSGRKALASQQLINAIETSSRDGVSVDL